MNNRTPVAALGLPEKTRRRIPWRVRPNKLPTPVGHVGKKYPNRPAKRSGKMGNTGVDRDQQVEIADNCRGFGKAPELGPQIENFLVLAKDRRVAGPNLLLQTEKLRLYVQQRQQSLQSNRPVAVVVMVWVAGPNKPNSW